MPMLQPGWVLIEHQNTTTVTVIGPFEGLREACDHLESTQVRGICEQDSLDCFAIDVRPENLYPSTGFTRLQPTKEP